MSSSGFINRPSPPPLAPKEQREFEDLLKRANAPMAHKSLDDWVKEADEVKKNPSVAASSTTETSASSNNNEETLTMHPDMRPKPKADFDGDANPSTGEVGGPKKEPLSHGDWSYGGRVTDF